MRGSWSRFSASTGRNVTRGGSIGLPESEHDRVATVIKPPRPPDLGDLTAETKAAFLTPWYTPGGRAPARLVHEVASAGGCATALALARVAEPFAREGRLGAGQLVSAETIAAATTERVAGPDRVLPYFISWGAGVIRSHPQGRYYGPGERTVGHTGFGGSCLLADPDRRLALAFVATRHSPALVEDPRAQSLIAATYAALAP